MKTLTGFAPVRIGENWGERVCEREAHQMPAGCLPPCGCTYAVFLSHIWGSSCNWSCHQIKFMTIRCHFPRFKRHLYRPKRQVKRGWHICAPNLPPGCDGGHGLRSSPWTKHPFSITILGGRVSSLAFPLMTVLIPHVRGAHLGTLRGALGVCATGRSHRVSLQAC